MSTTESTTPSPRLQEFQTEVDSMKVDGGKANPERTWTIIGALLMIAGVVLSLIAWLNISGSKTGAWTDDFAAMIGAVHRDVTTPVLPVLAGPAHLRAARADRSDAREELTPLWDLRP
jgi:hypothetical protein